MIVLLSTNEAKYKPITSFNVFFMSLFWDLSYVMYNKDFEYEIWIIQILKLFNYITVL